jgi:hypothetical protein
VGVDRDGVEAVLVEALLPDVGREVLGVETGGRDLVDLDGVEERVRGEAPEPREVDGGDVGGVSPRGAPDPNWC